jgi:hypothetical protein
MMKLSTVCAHTHTHTHTKAQESKWSAPGHMPASTDVKIWTQIDLTTKGWIFHYPFPCLMFT